MFVSGAAGSEWFWLLQEQAENSLKPRCCVIYIVCGKHVTQTNLKNVLEG